ncbi:uncharacterized protein EV154DRAFT_608258 [Mucor mucedo]|uniref:uncharacterized protein n=1 Tax=Mucor mucedo TaxID=29922 RepID=UPI002220F8F9|nr:uncharacterized protein EV154DRAFT_608258 [Mucor mucedo]KAI7864959.1 hypothetical protein EV154DRAFT_608258 [Mucor mucedo]
MEYVVVMTQEKKAASSVNGESDSKDEEGIVLRQEHTPALLEANTPEEKEQRILKALLEKIGRESEAHVVCAVVRKVVGYNRAHYVISGTEAGEGFLQEYEERNGGSLSSNLEYFAERHKSVEEGRVKGPSYKVTKNPPAIKRKRTKQGQLSLIQRHKKFSDPPSNKLNETPNMSFSDMSAWESRSGNGQHISNLDESCQVHHSLSEKVAMVDANYERR